MPAATEQLHKYAQGLDQRPLPDVATILVEAQICAARSAMNAISPICSGASAMAKTVKAGGALYYTAAGSSGLMAAADAMEIGGTFGISEAHIRILMAGGLPTSAVMPGATEDETHTLERDLASLSAKDTMIAVSASGSTAYTVAAAQLARTTGATVIGIANNAGSPLLSLSDHAILLETPPEVVSGSTRMGAGTAQKIALNMLSTLMAVELGHIHDGMMVNLRADNAKLRDRAASIVHAIIGCTDQAASVALKQAEGNVKLAALLAAGTADLATAKTQLEEAGGNLRAALERQKQET